MNGNHMMKKLLNEQRNNRLNYFSNKNSFFHGIMFHHFHDENIHKKGQGSINQNEFYKLIKFIGRDNILDASEFFNRFKENKLSNKNVCISFDDGLKCQFDIALPVLEDLKIKSFFFVYSSIFKGEPDLLEINRYFRMNYFDDIDEFYDSFFLELNDDLSKFFQEKDKSIKNIKIKFPFYSINDIKFRLVRDELLTKDNYKDIMCKMFYAKQFKPEDYYEILFLNDNSLNEIKNLGHLIGLHSHTHPTRLENLSVEDQTREYNDNISILSEILNCDKNEFKYMSHPCGSYNQDTLKILEGLGVELGFKQIMSIESEKNMKTINNSFLEIAREDHSSIMKMMQL